MITYRQYVTRLIEWTEDYLDYVNARIEFDQHIKAGFTYEESFEMIRMEREEAST